MTRSRLPLATFVLAVVAALGVALVACGGSSGGGGKDPNKVLDQTFSSSNAQIKSGDVSIKLNVNASGSQGGSLNAELSGPYQSLGKTKVPKLDFSVKADVSGQGQNVNFDGGLISTGNAAYINYKGTDYQVTPALFGKYQQLLAQAAAQQPRNQQSGKQLFNLLGVKDPKSLLTNLRNEGETDVEGTTTNHVSGDLDVSKTVDALKNVLSSASALQALGGGNSRLPSASQLDQVKRAIKTAHFDIYSGKDDNILRRLTINFSIQPPAGSVDKLDLNFDVSIGKVNQPQTITAPSGAKPFGQLLQQLGVSPSQLGASGGGSSNGGTNLTPPSGSAPSAQQAQKYLTCVSQAKSAADIQRCQSLVH